MAKTYRELLQFLEGLDDKILDQPFSLQVDKWDTGETFHYDLDAIELFDRKDLVLRTTDV